MSTPPRATPLLLAASLFGCGPAAPASPAPAEASAAGGAEKAAAAASDEASDADKGGADKGGAAVRLSAPERRGPDASIRDPSWFRTTIFSGATIVKEGRSPADENGLFASQITMQLADGTTREACVEHLKETVGADVPDLAIEDQGDRTALSGSAEHYTVTLLCGEAKGKMTAYISYRWTSLPAGG
ncbi:MAG: hypothetical protein R3A79_04435 [Nannocystaceae bacterium]